MSRQGTTPSQETAKDKKMHKKSMTKSMTDRFCGLSYFFRRFFRKDKTEKRKRRKG